MRQCRNQNAAATNQCPGSAAFCPHMTGSDAAPAAAGKVIRNSLMDDISRSQPPSPQRSRWPGSISRSAAAPPAFTSSRISSLHIGRGEAIGLVGPSGSGKSTLLMVMAGLERADTGSIVVAGERSRQARRGRAGALPRPQCRHRVSVLSSDPDHDRARECRGAARTRGRRRRL